ncbi:hypothetical protein [Paenibacillus urinalis]|uniref:hypothetical protein n=1 Tax=Paenibacillus urinalis TaxID=521520 RepID=UPI001960C6EE
MFVLFRTDMQDLKLYLEFLKIDPTHRTIIHTHPALAKAFKVNPRKGILDQEIERNEKEMKE